MRGLELVRGWFREMGWTPYPFQESAWSRSLEGESGLIHVPTGAGKTYAAYMGPLARLIEANVKTGQGLRILYITPLKAVSRDIALALQQPVEALRLPFRVETRTGDTSASARARQKKSLPEILVTTPESFSLLLSYKESAESFANVDCVILDEWHELLESKRGSLLELDLARLRALCPRLQTWALTATVANLEEAACAAVGTERPFSIVQANLPRPVLIETLLPEEVDSFPWAGHLGLRMLEPLLSRLDPERSTLIFVNTKPQAERWYQALREQRPDWADRMALHHGSIDRGERERVEAGVKIGDISLVVCTSSLDLGVDFGPVERVVQIGSPKGIARLIQRAGRSGHRPGSPCHLLFVPTNALELVEIAAARDAVERAEIEPRSALHKPLDVLVQHLVTRALGGGFTFEEIFAEARSAHGFKSLTPGEMKWALDLVVRGGSSLQGYPAYHKVVETDGRFVVENARIAKLHRFNIGTIVSDATVELHFARGGRVGVIDEGFVSKLKRGDRFVFAGRVLEFLRMKDLKAQVRLATGQATVTTGWHGSRLPFSESLARAIRRKLTEAAQGTSRDPEIQAARPLLETQASLSVVPTEDSSLVELCRTREGHHLFAYPFEGRALHEGLAAVLALRLSRAKAATFALSANDYGLELLCPEEFPFRDLLTPELFSDENLLSDVVTGMNMAALAKMQFREIARVAGLIFQSYPGAAKTMRQVQASSSLLFDVFQRYDPGNLLLRQAERQVLERQMDIDRLRATLRRWQAGELALHDVSRPTPLGFALVAERISARLSSESLMDRLSRMKAQWSRV